MSALVRPVALELGRSLSLFVNLWCACGTTALEVSLSVVNKRAQRSCFAWGRGGAFSGRCRRGRVPPAPGLAGAAWAASEAACKAGAVRGGLTGL